jgi:hypothetical protein
MRRLETFTGGLAPRLALLTATLLALHACQDPTDPRELPNFAGTADKQLTILGGGTGSGTVTVPISGGRKAINCIITAGVAAGGTDCARYYPIGTVVTLTPTPAAGSTFIGWSDPCTGTGPCTVTMSVIRKITAKFSGPPQSFALTVTGGGSGSGTVVGDASAPAINCTVTGGVAGTTGCSTKLAPATVVTLTASPTGASAFVAWEGACTGSTSQCVVTISAAKSVRAVFAAASTPAPEATLGRWDRPFSTPVTAIHLALLPSNKVVLWGEPGQPWIWDPSTYPADPASGYTEVPTATELFCAGHTWLADGRLLVTGGQDPLLGHDHGIPDVNYWTGTGWSSAPPMAFGRWYPTATTLGNGSVVVVSGGDLLSLKVPTPEIFENGAWRPLLGALLVLPYYPRQFVEPKQGRLFYAGEEMMSRYLDPNANGGLGAWTNVGKRKVIGRSYGTAVLIDGKVTYIGGGGTTCPQVVANNAEVIDLNAGTPSWRLIAATMAYRRRQLNATILADGKVLVTGGTTACGFNDASGAVLAAEMYDPVTEQWTTMASERVVRLYHSTAILMPDGRVMASGSGTGSQNNAEMYTPPSLFNPNGTLATRPTYSMGSTDLGYSQAFTVQSPDAADISRVTLVRLSAVTHAFNETQQLNTLSFTRDPGNQSLTVTTPPNGNHAPPGPYMLFLINAHGVPSVAQIVSLR